MKGRTRLFVTNQIQFLQACDRIVALGHREVMEQGTFAKLTSKDDGELRRILDDDKISKQHDATSNGKAASAPKDVDAEITEAVVDPPHKQLDLDENHGLISKEERNIGAVKWEVYKKYMVAGGGFLKFTFVFFIFLLCVLVQLASTAWVSFWTSDVGYHRFPPGFYLGLYAAIAVGLGVFTYARTFMLVRFGVNASGVLHRGLMFSILAAPQSFFDTTPVGRILSRFSKDLYSIDVEVSDNLDFFLSMVLSVIISLGSILFVTPWFGIAVLPLGYFYMSILNYFRDVSRETKRLESVSRSPVYAHFSETLGGLTTIRAYGQSARFHEEFDRKSDENIRAYYCIKTADRWLSVRLEFIGAIIAGLSAVFACNVVISNSVSGHGGSQGFSSLAGLSISFAISITGMLNWCVRTFAQLEAGMNGVERVLYYSEEIAQEAPRTSAALQSHALSDGKPPPSDPSAFAVVASGGKVATASADWPDQGNITLCNLRMKYRPETPLVLKGLNVSISAGERIGVVGRTGSGKSSLLLTLLRLVEPYLTEEDGTKYQAPLSIDGVDVLRIGLKELRSKLGIIPQNPVLFSGTIRSNVDPFDEYNDEEIWSALERCGMRQAVEEMPGMLSGVVAEYGENLSAGSRQMLVLGRALLKQCRILL
jgi:ABC-type multidrug transport system fused ATPase/permease subunit